MKVFWTELAVRQRNLVFDYWNRRNASRSYSKKLHLKIRHCITILKHHPEAGRKTDFEHIRVLFLEHYSLLYRCDDTDIHILAFWDNRQSEEKLLAILKDTEI
jgi:plasmid stabilization system protein ParE